MTGAEKKLAMVWAMGFAEGKHNTKLDNELVSVPLRDYIPEWGDYTFVAVFNPKNRNDRYSVYVRKPFGAEESTGMLISVECGYSLEHTLHLLITAIDLDMAERKEETDG